MDDEILKDLEKIYTSKYVKLEETLDMLERLKKYRDICSEELKYKIDSGISYCENIIANNEARMAIAEQIEIFEKAANSFPSNKTISVMMDHDSLYYKLFIKVGVYDMFMQYKLMYSEIRTWFYFNTKPFMLKNKEPFAFIEKSRGDYYIKCVSDFNWGTAFKDILNQMKSNYDVLLKTCAESCAYNPDGTPKYQQWKNFAKIKVVRLPNDILIQGVKNGEIPHGSHVVGGNGSFRKFNKGDYVIEYTVERVSLELPIRQSHLVDVDSYIRELKEKNGWRNLPYKLINPRLPSKVAVITYDMDEDPRERQFFPIEYGGSWLQLLKDALKDL